ncbi:MAG: tetraacyldisaccharide 4'-kinase, partial [Catalinimonas sp.]
VLFSGIANPAPLRAYAEQHFDVRDGRRFPDHHRYTARDLADLGRRADAAGAGWLTTEKDAVRLLEDALRPHWSGRPVYYLPIEVRFLWETGGAFLRLLRGAVTASR